MPSDFLQTHVNFCLDGAGNESPPPSPPRSVQHELGRDDSEHASEPIRLADAPLTESGLAPDNISDLLASEEFTAAAPISSRAAAADLPRRTVADMLADLRSRRAMARLRDRVAQFRARRDAPNQNPLQAHRSSPDATRSTRLKQVLLHCRIVRLDIAGLANAQVELRSTGPPCSTTCYSGADAMSTTCSCLFVLVPQFYAGETCALLISEAPPLVKYHSNPEWKSSGRVWSAEFGIRSAALPYDLNEVAPLGDADALIASLNSPLASSCVWMIHFSLLQCHCLHSHGLIYLWCRYLTRYAHLERQVKLVSQNLSVLVSDADARLCEPDENEDAPTNLRRVLCRNHVPESSLTLPDSLFPSATYADRKPDQRQAAFQRCQQKFCHPDLRLCRRHELPVTLDGQGIICSTCCSYPEYKTKKE